MWVSQYHFNIENPIEDYHLTACSILQGFVCTMGNKSANIQFKTLLPHCVVIVWLIFLGVTIWSHAVSSQQPPIYDSLTYFLKGKTFWENIDRGEWLNPFNTKPTARPPGTIMMSFPFGYSSDFHGFNFRSVYFPILSVVIAVYMVIGLSRARKVGWGVAGVAMLLSSLPLLYQFEWVEDIPSPGHWGMVDTFQAGVASLATAAFLRSLTTGSQRWLGLGSALASFTLLIKPSGLMVMALLGLSWFILAMWEWRTAALNPEQPVKDCCYVRIGALQVVLIFTFFVSICVLSEYFSPANFAHARQALPVMKDVLAIPLSQYPLLIHRSMGEAVFVWAMFIITLYWASPYCRSGLNERGGSPQTIGFLLMACLIWGGGVWYWLVVQAGGNQIRYFFPFAMIGLIYVVPMGIQVWMHAKIQARALIMVICILPAVNIACLLIQKNPSVPWQKATGVNISVGTSCAEEDQAHIFLGKVRKEGRNATVYSFQPGIAAPSEKNTVQSGIAAAVFENVGSFEKIVRPDSPTFITYKPIDWKKGSVTRLDDLLSAEYVLFHPVKDDAERQGLMQLQGIGDFGLEIQVFQAWLSGLTEKNGVRLVSETRVRLLKIIDYAQFERDLDLFVADRSWRAAFNKANPRRYWSAAETLLYIRTPMEKDIQFGDLYTLHALTIRHGAEGMRVEIWWEEMRHKEDNKLRFMFFHLIDAQGKIYYNQQIGLRYTAIHPDRRWRYDSITFPLPVDPKVKSLAFGISHPNRQTGNLVVDKGSGSWGGHRQVVVPLTAVK